MNYEEYLVQNTPKISVSKKKITIDSKNGNTCSLRIENIAGGFLCGKIKIYDSLIKLSETEFDKNLVDIDITVDFDLIKTGEKLNKKVQIFSNGGDVEVELVIIKDKICYEINEFVKIYTMKDLYEFAKKDIKTVSTFFGLEDFEQFILETDQWNFEIYKFCKNIDNIYKRIDEFFILLGFKSKTEIIVLNNSIEIDMKYLETKNMTKKIKIRKTDFGFCDCNLSYNENSFLKIAKTSIPSEDFIENNEIEIEVEILVDKISWKKNKAEILINNKVIDIIVNKNIEPVVKFDREIYKDEEKGIIFIENTLGMPINYEIISDSKNIEIHKDSGVLEESEKIDFDICFTKFNKGVVKFFGQPYFDANIVIKFFGNGYKLKKEVKLILATDNLELK